MWHSVPTVLLTWVPVESWDRVDGSPEVIEEALQKVSSGLQDSDACKSAGQVGWIHLTTLKADRGCRPVYTGNPEQQLSTLELEGEVESEEEPEERVPR